MHGVGGLIGIVMLGLFADKAWNASIATDGLFISGSPEFFLRKAIGWALRQYAWTDPKEVVRYVKAHAELSGLSKREALKNVVGCP